MNMSGVIPPIFASSLILFPATLAGWFTSGDSTRWIRDLAAALSPGQPLYTLLYAALIIFFAFFYTALVFNPKETAENLKKSGASSLCVSSLSSLTSSSMFPSTSAALRC